MYLKLSKPKHVPLRPLVSEVVTISSCKFKLSYVLWLKMVDCRDTDGKEGNLGE